MNAIEATNEAALESAETSSKSDEDRASEVGAVTGVVAAAVVAAVAADALAEGKAEASADADASDDERAPGRAPASDADDGHEEVEDDELEPAVTSEDTDPANTAADEPGERLDRKKLEEQLEALKKKEAELRRALLMADHPALTEAIRAIQGRTYAIGRVEAKLAQGPSKSEARRRDTLNKKVSSLREKRAEIDEQLTQLETELAGLGADRTQLYEAERREAIEQLFVALGTHDAAFREVGLEPTAAVPEIVRFLPEIEALAEQHASKPTPD